MKEEWEEKLLEFIHCLASRTAWQAITNVNVRGDQLAVEKKKHHPLWGLPNVARQSHLGERTRQMQKAEQGLEILL